MNYRYLQISLKESGIIWHYGDPDSNNLGGTARTLDRANGRIPLGQGLVSLSGWSIVDDTRTLVLDDSGALTNRNAQEGYRDFYFLGYAQDYLSAIRDYQQIAGKPGLIPRWALGNWWSRYWAYTQEELTDLILDFQQHRIPLSVCIVDMDWHITKTAIAPQAGPATPGIKSFFRTRVLSGVLHDNNLKTALNLHPAEGVHPHETQYEDMARAVGIDPASNEPVPFDVASEILRVHILKSSIIRSKSRVSISGGLTGSRAPGRKKGLDPLYALNELQLLRSRQKS